MKEKRVEQVETLSHAGLHGTKVLRFEKDEKAKVKEKEKETEKESKERKAKRAKRGAEKEKKTGNERENKGREEAEEEMWKDHPTPGERGPTPSSQRARRSRSCARGGEDPALRPVLLLHRHHRPPSRGRKEQPTQPSPLRSHAHAHSTSLMLACDFLSRAIAPPRAHRLHFATDGVRIRAL